MVGRAGMGRSGLMSVSWEFSRVRPEPSQTRRMASSEGPVHPKISPVIVTTEEGVRVGSNCGSFAFAISFNPGKEKARVVVPKTPTIA